MSDPDASRCPLCGGANGCAMDAGDPSPCWCTTVSIDRATLDRIPEALRGLACVCRACATGASREDTDATRVPR